MKKYAILNDISSGARHVIPGITLPARVANKDDAISAFKNMMRQGGIDATDMPIMFLGDASGSYYAPQGPRNEEHFAIDKNDPIVSSHEFGHFKDYHNRPNKLAISDYLLTRSPLFRNMVSGAARLESEAQANMKSWKALKLALKDDPEMLKEFGDLRTQALTRAYMTYLADSGGKIIGGGLGAYGGDSLVRKLLKPSKKLSESQLLKLSPEERRKARKSYNKSRVLNGLARLAGAHVGDEIGGAIALPARLHLNQLAVNEAKRYQSSAPYKARAKALMEKVIKKFGKK